MELSLCHSEDVVAAGEIADLGVAVAAAFEVQDLVAVDEEAAAGAGTLRRWFDETAVGANFVL
jgi:hypothetical protein